MRRDGSQRTIIIGEPECNFSFPSNYVTTTRYHLVTFFPLCLAYQFKRLSNWYFLITAVLQSISIISPLAPFSAIMPLAFVLCVSILREGIEDFLRYRSDKRTNTRIAHVHNGIQFENKPFHAIRVGDIIQVQENEGIPCDMVMLASGLSTGRAYVETANLDGEKFLKIKECIEAINQDSKEPNGDLKTKLRYIGLLRCDHPNPKLHEFSGLIQHKRDTFPLAAKHILLTGSVLKNTNWILGVSVYTGDDTKLRQSTSVSRYKMSRIERLLNRYIIGVIFVELCLCLVTGVLESSWQDKNWDNHIYLHDPLFAAHLSGFLTFFTYFLLLNTMLPISLIVTLEIIKVLQAFFMMNDLEMKNSDHFCKVSSMSLNEELGMIEHILTDKTGTLTCNKMEFQTCFIGQTEYMNQVDAEERRRLLANTKREDQTLATYVNEELVRDLRSPGFGPLPDCYPILGRGNKELLSLSSQHDFVQHFMNCLALCHECVVEKKDFDSNKLKKQGTIDPNESFQEIDNEVRFISQSPDEIALVELADRMGYKYRGIQHGQMRVYTDQGSMKKFERLNVLEFSSDRRRSSVIVRSAEDGKVYVYSKGADSMIISRLSEHSRKYLPSINNTIEIYSRKGWRTLVMAFRVLEEEEYAAWAAKYKQAQTTPGAEKDLEALNDEIERDLYLLGCTGVEDSLQDEVKDTITAFLRAKIKLWMLTGDKMETAENIAKTCGLIQDNFTVYRFPTKPFAWVKQQMEVMRDELSSKGDFAIVIEDRSILYQVAKDSDMIFAEENAAAEDVATVHSIFQATIQRPACKTVVCCRVSPGLKRQVVQLVKATTGAICLAVGDGANDVAMIKEADIGVGIYGQEGVQAVQASDYAVGEFKFLWDLLIAHGHWNYIRQSRMILYFFYKNFVFTIPQFYFSFYCAYSGQTTFDDWYITFYNMILTALPLMARALLEKDVIPPTRAYYHSPSSTTDEAALKKVREYMADIYYVGQNNMIFNWVLFLGNILNGFLHSFAIFFIPMYVFEESKVMDSEGHNSDMWAFSITAFSCILLTVNMKLALASRYWNWFNILCTLGFSIGLYFAFIFIYDRMTTTPALYTLWMLCSSAKYWLTIVAVLGLIAVMDGFLHFIIMNVTWKPPVEGENINYRNFLTLLSFSKSDALRNHELALRKRVGKRIPLVSQANT